MGDFLERQGLAGGFGGDVERLAGSEPCWGRYAPLHRVEGGGYQLASGRVSAAALGGAGRGRRQQHGGHGQMRGPLQLLLERSLAAQTHVRTR